MGIFDKLKSTAKQAVNTAASSAAHATGLKSKTFLWQQYLLAGVPTPKSGDPWA